MGDAVAPVTGKPEPTRHRFLSAALLFVGLIALSDARYIVRDWATFGPALRSHYVIGLTAASILVAVGLRGLVKGLSRVSVMVSAGTLMAVGTSQILGVLSNVIPCSGPT